MKKSYKNYNKKHNNKQKLQPNKQKRCSKHLSKSESNSDLNEIILDIASIPRFFLERREIDATYYNECMEYIDDERMYEYLAFRDDITIEEQSVNYRSVKKFPFISTSDKKIGSYICIGKISVHRGDLLVLESQDSDPLRNGAIYLYGEVKGFYYQTPFIEPYYVSSGLCDYAEGSSYLLIDKNINEETLIPGEDYHCEGEYEDMSKERYGLIKVAKNFDEFKLGKKFKENFIQITVYD